MFKVDTQSGGKRSSPSKSPKTPPKRRSVSKTKRKSSPKSKPVRKSSPKRKPVRKSSPKRKPVRKSSPKRKPVHKSSPKRKSGRKSPRKSGHKSSPKRKPVRKSSPKRKPVHKSSPKRKSPRKSGRKSSQRGGTRRRKRITAITNDRNYDMSGPRKTESRLLPFRGVADSSQVMINSREALRRNMAQTERQIENDCGWIKDSGLDYATAERLTADCARNVEDRLDNQFNRPDHRDLINTYDPRTHTPAQLQRDRQWLGEKAGQAAYLGQTLYNYGVKPTAQLAYNYGLKPAATAVGKRIGRNTRKQVTLMVDRDGESPFEH